MLEKVPEWLKPLGEMQLMPTTGPGSAGSLAAEAVSDGASLVVVFGGDGTIHEAANGMMGSSVPLAPLPGGTANVLCVETKLGTDPKRAARRLVNESIAVRIAAGRMSRPDGTARYFLMMAGIGLDAMVVEQVSAAVKHRLGKVAYWISGFSMVGRKLPQFDATMNGSTSRRSFVLVSRVRNYGGDLEIAKNVTLLDPQFEAVCFAGMNSMRYLPYLAGVAVSQVERIPGVSVQPAKRISCAASNGDRVPVQLDGEKAGYLPADFEIVPDALTLLIPSAYVKKAREHKWITSPTH